MSADPAPHPAPHPADDPSEVTTRQQLAVGDCTFDVTLAGPATGRPALLLHGFPQTAWSWRHVIPLLVGAGRRVVTVDQRGYSTGAQPDAPEQCSGEHLVGDVLGLLEELDLPPVDMVGHDWAPSSPGSSPAPS